MAINAETRRFVGDIGDESEANDFKQKITSIFALFHFLRYEQAGRQQCFPISFSKKCKDTEITSSEADTEKVGKRVEQALTDEARDTGSVQTAFLLSCADSADTVRLGETIQNDRTAANGKPPTMAANY